ncbi:hypothetical protein D3C85_1240370 [compost metagenome]
MLAIIKRLGTGLHGFELVFQCLPAIDVGVFVRKPFSGCAEQRRDLVHELRRTSLQGIKRVIEVVHHRQQVDHPPAQFLGIAYGLPPRTFVGQLADHQFKGVESRHQR